MKTLNKKICIIGLIIVFATTGCNDFLDIYNPSANTIDFYDSKDGQERLILDLYSRYRNVFGEGNLQYFGTDMYVACDESPNSAQFNGYNKDLSGLSGVIGGYWTLLYKIVQESNILLNRCKPEIAGNDYDRMIAEASFFRVMAYYYLVETYGPVPLLVTENTDVENVITSVTREEESVIYNFMITELEGVKGKIPNVATEAGKLSDTALRLFLGKLYLTRSYRSYTSSGDVSNAISNFESVISSTHYRLLPRFADVFSEDNQNNNEVIWAIQYGSDKNFNGGGNPQHAQFGFNITALYPGMFTLNQKDYSAMQRYYWINPIVHEWFKNPDIDARYKATFKREFYINNPSHKDYGKLGIYMPTWNDTSNDNKGAEYYYPFKKPDGSYNWYPAIGAMGWNTDCMPMCQKFKETKIDWGGRGTREDIIFRMADAYLLCAEAYLKNGQKTEALEKVNLIIKRAAETDENYEIMKINSELTLDRLLEERGCELLGEHDRWFDLKRTGTLLIRAKLNPLVVKYDNMSDIHLVRPIPYDERIKLEGLEQNKGYNN